MAMGEAAGTASALSIREGVTPRNMDVRKIQEALVAHGAILDPEPVPESEAYPVYVNPLKEHPELLKKYL